MWSHPWNSYPPPGVRDHTKLVGLALGIGGAAFGMRALTSILYGITPGHLPTFAVVATILFGVATASSYLPARRASRITPVQALRDG